VMRKKQSETSAQRNNGIIQRMRVVLDTNVFVSAVFFGGTPGTLLPLIDSGIITPCFTSFTFEELTDVLRREEFVPHHDKLASSILEFLLHIKDHALFFESLDDVPNYIPQDPDDNLILACALSAGVKHIISGDAHLLALKKFNGISILTPTQFLRVIRRG
jgi:uncharacterized protein